jgi:hypothetical protein
VPFQPNLLIEQSLNLTESAADAKGNAKKPEIIDKSGVIYEKLSDIIQGNVSRKRTAVAKRIFEYRNQSAPHIYEIIHSRWKRRKTSDSLFAGSFASGNPIARIERRSRSSAAADD